MLDSYNNCLLGFPYCTFGYLLNIDSLSIIYAIAYFAYGRVDGLYIYYTFNSGIAAKIIEDKNAQISQDQYPDKAL